ncbi:hypothetical protein CXG81DRAFT_19273 [Caulochytrium protostelioides]|uniref:Uncharacterized protein n=1 Tax=Caulochytrium protostelioides TaxID=1555241 RepID=A0A4P9X6M3_9FUNG|nr:hypothetical protein CXG81DRAFT_19273 [Caulochytrium protostelioides]|eukprot:RKP00833.1 hypothetical protein CXG81DRAFT_19273 [Caulochytrium protostelioides]
MRLLLLLPALAFALLVLLTPPGVAGAPPLPHLTETNPNGFQRFKNYINQALPGGSGGFKALEPNSGISPERTAQQAGRLPTPSSSHRQESFKSRFFLGTSTMKVEGRVAEMSEKASKRAQQRSERDPQRKRLLTNRE